MLMYFLHTVHCQSSSRPPPQHQPPTATGAPFMVHFRSGKISKCYGCRRPYTKNHRIVLRHEEHREYTNPRSGREASRYQNVYYHLKKSCVKAVWGVELSELDIIVPDALMPQLTATEKSTLHKEFGVNL